MATVVCRVRNLSLFQTRVLTCSFSSSSVVSGKKSRVPFDKRFPVTAKDVHRHKEGGSVEMEQAVAMHIVQPSGYVDERNKRFTTVKEMIPEFVVPDLTNFQLKPYVSYKVPEIHQTRFTARDLFNACYAEEVRKRYDDSRD
ncbi:39S ribosomal protein L41, mitochondrial-like [Gigantopelta aegis]|uniref:39S ribosomal protein L41, mitochondrial-like n=1 Tax=Gigantopelta aegis TaxID=1735272 RepID=UPI001B887FB1|nr:39S ribosomal protein L41, mitochondrial-like [Gigantopelta aegis]